MMTSAPHRKLGKSFSGSMVILAVAAAILVGISLLNIQPAGILYIDPEQWAAGAAQYGLLSKISMYLWLAPAMSCGIAAHLLRTRNPEWSSLFSWASALNWLYLVSDGFLLHEAVQQFGVPRWLLYAVYALLAASLLTAFRALLLKTNITALLSACAGLGAATFMKLFLRAEPHFLIEGVKLTALTCWSVYFCRLSIQRLRDSHPAGTAERLISARHLAFVSAIVALYALTFAGIWFSGVIEHRYELVREPVFELNLPLYTGLLSNAGIVIMAAGGFAALLAGLASRADSHTQERQFLLAVGAFVLMLNIDDYYLLHEEIEWHFGISQSLIYGIYGLAALGVAIRYRQMLLKSFDQQKLLVFGAICLGIALIMDIHLFDLSALPHADNLEEGLELLGMLSWCLYLLKLSMLYLDRLSEPSSRLAIQITQHDMAS